MFAAGNTTLFLAKFGDAESKNDHQFGQSALVFAISRKKHFFILSTILPIVIRLR